MRKKYPTVKWLQAARQPAVRRRLDATIPTATCSTFRKSTWRTAPRSMSRTTARSTPATSITWRSAPCGPTRWRNSIAMCSSSRRRTRSAGDRNHYLTDGHMTLVIMPWDITDYDGTGIITPAWTISASRSKASTAQGRRRAYRRRQPAPGAQSDRDRQGRRGARQAVRAQLRHRRAPPRRSRRHPDPRDGGLASADDEQRR